jgi:hypothetical protein
MEKRLETRNASLEPAQPVNNDDCGLRLSHSLMPGNAPRENSFERGSMGMGNFKLQHGNYRHRTIMKIVWGFVSIHALVSAGNEKE